LLLDDDEEEEEEDYLEEDNQFLGLNTAFKKEKYLMNQKKSVILELNNKNLDFIDP
jgi:hypothetical protein